MRELLLIICAAAIVLICMPYLIEYMRKRQMGQTIYKLGPQAHLDKQGTPNMGGMLIASGAVLTSLAFALHGASAWALLPLLLASLGTMAVGFADDYLKVVRKQHEGLKPLQKVVGQVAVGLLYSLYCYVSLGSSILLPFTRVVWDLGVFYVPVMTLLFMFLCNSANLQDGADGLLGSVSVVGGIAMGVVALLLKRAANPVLYDAAALLMFALVGACIGFLKFNRYPAKIMMGDTGSMFIGGVFAAVAMALGAQLWLLPICFTMLMSSLSVIMQRTYYKLTHGKRIFKMSPIHHHFELSGMNENGIVRMYTLVAIVMGVIAVAAVLPIVT